MPCRPHRTGFRPAPEPRRASSAGQPRGVHSSPPPRAAAFVAAAPFRWSAADVTRVRGLLVDPRFAPFVFLLPFLAIFVVFRVWPAIMAGMISFQSFKGVDATTWVGLANYTAVFDNPRFGKALANTTLYTIGTL